MARSFPSGPRRRPGRPRRRPGRRPPYRYRSRAGPPVPQGFTTGVFGAYYNWLLPDLRGREKRLFFNRISRGLILGTGFIGGWFGYGWLGMPGAAVGFCVGLLFGVRLSLSQRLYRP